VSAGLVQPGTVGGKRGSGGKGRGGCEVAINCASYFLFFPVLMNLATKFFTKYSLWSSGGQLTGQHECHVATHNWVMLSRRTRPRTRSRKER